MQLWSDIVVTHHLFPSTSVFNDTVIEDSGTFRKEACFFLKQHLKPMTPMATTLYHHMRSKAIIMLMKDQTP